MSRAVGWVVNDFFWSSGHLGWGVFAVVVFSGLWLLLADVIWRLRNIKIRRFAAIMAMGWLVGSLLIVLGFAWL